MIVMSIAGVDPSGGAGVLTDIKAFQAIGVYGTGVVTALIKFINSFQHYPLVLNTLKNKSIPLWIPMKSNLSRPECSTHRKLLNWFQKRLMSTT